MERESYDDDLAWILTRFSERADAACAVMLKYDSEAASPSVLATFDPGAALDGVALGRLCAELGAMCVGDPVQERAVSLDAGGGQPLHCLGLRFVPAPGVHIVAAVLRHEAGGSLPLQVAAKTLRPVLDRYVRLWWLHRTERRRARVFQHILDQTDLGVLLLDRHAVVLYANAAASRVLEPTDAPGRGPSILGATHLEGHSRLLKAVHAAIQQNIRAASHGLRPSLLTLGRAGRRALIVSVGAAESQAIDPADAAAVLYLLDPDKDVSALLGPIFSIYQLTGAESRLVTSLVRGEDLAAAAAGMNLAIHTARSYLKQVFVKTGTNRQVELVRIMCSSATRVAASCDLQSTARRTAPRPVRSTPKCG